MRLTLTNLQKELYTFVGYLKMCDEKGKPFVRMGPRFRQILNVFDFAGSGVAKHKSNLAKPEQSYRARVRVFYRAASCRQKKQPVKTPVPYFLV